jgi:hypothetical protein
MNEVTESIRPLLALAFPMICALLIFVFRKRPNIRESYYLNGPHDSARQHHPQSFDHYSPRH